ncbi:unnamed protein product [Brassica rapa]|uniref:Uncharacterized protein n=1 Tax=Brassica campestris TaxID=3711 RepID=A0A8D9GBE1_BRACM|nr:unnamed protein product [Brassica rapa]
MLICVVSVLIYVLISQGKDQHSPRGPKSPEQSTGRAGVLSPRTSVLICVVMDSHGRSVHRRPVRADGQPRTSCVCWRTPTDVLCVLNIQPTWAKITRTVHAKGQPAESKDQRADMCTDGQPRTSCVPRGPKSPEQSTGRVSVLTMDVLCVMTDTHGRPVCADRHPQTSCVHTRTHTDSHGRPVCADGQQQTARTQPTWAKITRTVHGKGQRTEVSVLSPRTNVLICVLMDSHRRPVCADGHTQTHTDSHRRSVYVLWVLTDTHGRPVCADGQPQTATDVLCTWTHTDSHGRPGCTEQTLHSTGRVSVLSPRTNVLICVLMDSHARPVCADGHTQTHTDSHVRYVCDGHTRTSCTAHVGQNYPNSPREGPAC